MGRSKRRQAEAIAQITEMAWRVAQRDLAARTKVEREAGQRMADLRASEARAEAAAMASSDMALRRSMELWSSQAKEQARALNIVIARSRAETEAERLAARRALARRDAAAKLRDRVLEQERNKQRTRDVS